MRARAISSFHRQRWNGRLDDNAGRVPHVWRRMRYEDESPLVVEKRYEDGRRLFYLGNFRFLRIQSEGVKRR